MYYLKKLLFTFLINTLVLSHYENFVNNYYNVSLIQNNVKRTSIKSRLLGQTQKHNPHYHNDPELKEIIDKINEEAIKKYQQTHDPYKQLKEVVEKNGKKYTGGNDAKHMSTLEKELLETYEETFGDKNNIMLKSGRYPNDNDDSDDSPSCECTDINNAKLEKTKGRDKYLKHLKGRCTRGIYISSLVTVILTYLGLKAAKAAAVGAFNIVTASGVNYNIYASFVTIFNMLSRESIISVLQTSAGISASAAGDLGGTAAANALIAIYPCGIAALVLLILTVILIILYIWLYRRRKRSLKHECKKHLCK
ncbi:stevor PIR protein, putative [Plasmodium reichenowi]|uniref:Stevor PIR protein, putative n=1 Tax=Plasmodium reichenowi TaxID=5854 RepID=A0A2P9DBB1_PLARE|nr:stevor PIR protein, putative [Plasmodium reichenowi]